MSTRSTSDWTDAKTMKLRQLWNEGLSTADIGRRLSVSKAPYRLDLPERSSPIKRCATPRPKRPRKRCNVPKLADIMPLRPQPAVMMSQPIEPYLMRPALRNEQRKALHSCVWPIGTPGKPGFRFCERQAVHGKPYCEEHCERAYLPPHTTDRDITAGDR
jgi:GcrA cell cycle regulator